MTIQPLPQTLHTLGLISARTEARILRFLLFSDHHRTIFVQVMDGGDGDLGFGGGLGARVPSVSTAAVVVPGMCPGCLAVVEAEAVAEAEREREAEREGAGDEQGQAGAEEE